jgi:hypothetical protein
VEGDLEDMCYEIRRAEACAVVVYYCRTRDLLKSCARGGEHVLQDLLDCRLVVIYYCRTCHWDP